MSLTLRVWQITDRLAEIEFKQVSLQPAVDGFKFRLVGHIEPGALPPEPIDLLDLTAGVSLYADQRPFLCDLRPETAINSVWLGVNKKQQIFLDGFISTGAVEAIEAVRKGNLQFYIGLRGLVCLNRPVIGTVPTVDGKPAPAGTYSTSSNTEVISFPRSDWEGALDSSGYGKLIHFDLSLPKAMHSQAVQEAYRQLGGAQKLLSQGNYLEVVVTCRRVLENLRDSTGIGDKALFEKAANNRNELTEAERVALVRAATLSLSQTGVHPDKVPETTPPTYAKAAAILYLAGLTAWLEEQQREGKRPA